VPRKLASGDESPLPLATNAGDNMFRFDYSPAFLRWALSPPGFKPEWHVGVRVTQARSRARSPSPSPTLTLTHPHPHPHPQLNLHPYP
jgi:glycylpeptide N-tetradecanoyltransferase